MRKTLRLWRRACGADGATFALHSGQPSRFGDRLAYSRYAFQYINIGLCACGAALVVLVVPSLRLILASQAGLAAGWRIAAMPPNILAHPCIAAGLWPCWHAQMGRILRWWVGLCAFAG